MTPAHRSVALRNRIVAAIPRSLTEVGARALDAFLELPSIEDWYPDNMYLANLSRVFDIGLPLSFFAGNATAEAHRREIASVIIRGGRCPTSLLSEVNAGAVLANWGGDISFVPRQANPTPDLETKWGDGFTLDVEVARGETRPLHMAVQGGVEAFVGALQPGDVEWNVAAFVADASKSDDLVAMFEAATTLRPEQSAENAGTWCVRAVPLDRRDDIVGARSTEIFAPSWWPGGEPTYSATSTLIGAMGNPVVQLQSLVPLASYLNPVVRKASSRQRRPGNPYLIALDVSDLPRAHERMVRDLSGYMSIWDHVSAVLLFEPRFWVGVERKEWVISMHRNSAATLPLPRQLAAIADGERLSVGFMLTQDRQ